MITSFAELAKDVVEDETYWRRRIDDARQITRDYLILFNARSGSTWLTEILTDYLGMPQEFINPPFIPFTSAAVRTRDQRTFLQALRGETQRKGVFGIEATGEHIALFGEDIFFETLSDIAVFHLWRENLVAQTISLFRAVKTGHFHTSAGEKPPAPSYDGDNIFELFRYLLEVENMNVRLLVNRNIRPINITYEEMVGKRAATMTFFYQSLNLAVPELPAFEDETNQRLADQWNADAEVRFRAEFGDRILRLEESRLTKLLRWQSRAI